MKRLLVVGALFALAFAQSNLLEDEDNTLCQRDQTPIFKYEILLPFNARVASEASKYTSGNFIISAHTIWLSLASVAESVYYSYEGTDGDAWWDSLNFPHTKCIRDQMYQLALSLEAPGAEFSRNRALAMDNNLKIQEDWLPYSNISGVLQYLSVNYDVDHFGRVQEYMGIEPKIPLTGHSVFLDRLDWRGLWTSAFTDDAVTEGPFYNAIGVEIANVEYIRMKTRVRAADFPDYNTRVVEVPVGSDGRYSILLAIGGDANTMIEAVFSRDVLSELSLTEEAIDVAIPRLSISSSMDLRPVLSNIGFGSLFTDPQATSFISEPSALPMGYLQRVDINITGSLGKEGSKEGLGFLGFSEIFEDIEHLFMFDNDMPDHYHFIANRPFLFSLFETRIGVPVFTGIYSLPGKRGQLDFLPY